MTSIAQAVQDLTANPRPILFLDTCSLLDIIRAPWRARPETVLAGIEMRDLARSGDVSLFVQDIVLQEWADNKDATRSDGEAGVEAFAATWRIAARLGHPAPPPPVLKPVNLIDALTQISRELLDSASVLDRDLDGLSWAIDRVARKKKPSSKGMVKDCHILGHALRLSSLLERVNYPRWRVFVSSNKSDFALTGTTDFHTDIAADASAAGLRYAVSLERAVDDLRAAGEIS